MGHPTPLRKPPSKRRLSDVNEEEKEEQNWEEKRNGEEEECKTTDANGNQKDEKLPATRSNARVEIKYKMPNLPLAHPYKGGEYFFVRECYDVYYLMVESVLLEKKETCVTVTGTPGIGKSTFYAYFFDRFYKTHPEWSIVASSYTRDGDIEQLALFEPNKYPRRIAWATQSFLDCLVLQLSGMNLADKMTWIAKEQKVLWLCDGPPKVSRSQMVVFTSPNERWSRITRDDSCHYYMPPWKLEELQLAASVLGYPISDDDIDERFWNFGGVARNCFRLNPADNPKTIRQLTIPIDQVGNRRQLENLLLRADECHFFLLYEPIGDGTQVETKLVSDLVYEKLSERLLEIIKLSMKKIDADTLLGGIPSSSWLRGWMFEAYAHGKLQQGVELKARLLTLGNKREKTKTFSILESAEMDIFECNSISPSLLDKGPYHKPKSKTLEAIDGFYFLKDTVRSGSRKKLKTTAPSVYAKDGRIIMFQMTLSKKCPVHASGVIYVLKMLGLLEIVKNHPKRAAIIFLCPAVDTRSFQRQKILSGGVSPQNIRDIKEIGTGTVKTLAEQYGINTVDELKAQVVPFKQESILMKDQKDRPNWARAVRSWEKYVENLNDPECIKMVINIPQYVAAFD